MRKWKGVFMASSFEIRGNKNGRVLVILHPACTITRKAILALLAEMGIDQASVIFLLPEEVEEHCSDIGDVPVVIPVDQASCDAPELDTAGRRCGQGGGRVIVLFGDGFSYPGLHPIAEKYGNQCAWSARRLEQCVKDPRSAMPRTSGGTIVNRPTSKQVKC
jgi:hypothetical protein